MEKEQKLELEKLKGWMEKQRNLLVDLQITISNHNRYFEPKYEWEPKIKQMGFFQYYHRQMRFIAFVQLSKLVSYKSTQKHSFHRLFNQLEKLKYDKDLNDFLRAENRRSTSEYHTREEVKRAVAVLRKELDTHKELINRIDCIRDQVYAHTDPEPVIQTVTRQELGKLLEVCTNIHNQLNLGFFFNQTQFNYVVDWDIDPVFFLIDMAMECDEREKEAKKKKGRNIGPLE